MPCGPKKYKTNKQTKKHNVVTNSIKTFKNGTFQKIFKKEIIPNTGSEAEIAFLDFQ